MNSMKQFLNNFLVGLAVFGTVLALASPVVAAPVDIFENNPACKTDPNNAICGKTGGTGEGVYGTIKNIINVMLVISGIVAVIVIIVGGISYSVSVGDPAKVKKAKDTILYALIGLVVAVAAFSIVNFVVGRI